MKKILVLLLLSFGLQAQTSYKEVDIDAASGNNYETLLTNVEYGYNDGTIQACLQKTGMIRSDRKFWKQNGGGIFTGRYEKQTVTGVEKQGYIYVKFDGKKIPQYSLPLTTKVEIYGDVQSIIKFYINYWSTDLNFNDVKVGEVVSTRFLSDVATLSFPDGNTAKITVVTAKDR
ncbi:MAG: hypothetical protein Q8R22_02865 [Flavobacterium sp.]|uniref:hypothetical protein n=1 Tax=Flavobacterium sp. TaxID=239 RepID=UPI0027349087|nr:hypothetical protein [Flavobacterium sp.]MDP3679759.1 hypothetical protein [Flavobacterium sp.]MDZ4331746.1 hypothetical protein [Flavobacterium sp.]